MSWLFFKVLPDVQSDIHLAQRNIASKLYGNFEILRDSLHNRNDSLWCTSKARQLFFFFLFIFSSEMLYKYFIFKVTLTNSSDFCLLLLYFCFALYFLCLNFLFLFYCLFVACLFGVIFAQLYWKIFFLSYSISQPPYLSDCKWSYHFIVTELSYIGFKKQMLTTIKGFSPKSLGYSGCLKFGGSLLLHVASHTH